MAAYKKGVLVHVGSIGTGFKKRQAVELRGLLDRLVTKKPPVAVEGRRPNVVVGGAGADRRDRVPLLTHNVKLRHASYKGLPEVQDNAVVFKLDD